MIARIIIITLCIAGHRVIAKPVDAPPAPTDTAKILLRKWLGKGSQLRVVVCPIGDPGAVPGLLQPNLPAPPKAAYCLQLRLLRPSHTPFVLWSVVRMDSSGTGVDQPRAYDVMLYQGHALIALAFGPSIQLWRVDLTQGAAEVFDLRKVDWPRFRGSTGGPPDAKRVTVHLWHDVAGSVSAVVSNPRADLHEITFFGQQGTEWNFVVKATSTSPNPPPAPAANVLPPQPPSTQPAPARAK